MNVIVDLDERQRIAESLNENLVVEAAAGTGKTTELVRRIVAVLARGLAAVDEIVAVTFTEKAAGELKLRLRTELEAARLKEAREGKAAIEHALAHLEEARIGTIHSFCADLLRERPVEARIDPAFEVLTESEAERLYGEAFSLWLQQTLEDPPEGVRRSLRRESRGSEDESPAERLRRAGWTLAIWRDMRAPWHRPPFNRRRAIDELVEQVHNFAALANRCSNSRDRLFEDTWSARRLSDTIRSAEAVRPRDHDALEARFVLLAQDWKFGRPRQGYDSGWRSGVTRAQVLEAHARLLDRLRNFKRVADGDLAALLQQELLGTIDRYERLKARAGKLDFLDLLLKARNLVVENDDVRADFQQRFARIFVDEFQDTDPLQAEILLLLASADPGTRDWRAVAPSPGKLFIVGDPKQSIYRFRRADVGTYQEVVALLESRGTTCLRLTTSFRAVPSIQRAINRAFEPLMTGDMESLQATYVPLSPARSEPEGQPAIVALPVPRPYGVSRIADTSIEKSLPDAVGAYVEWLVRDSGWTVTERDRGDRVPLTPRHICILFRRFENLYKGDMARAYVKSLEARGIPHLLVGGRSFHAREEVATLRAALAAIEWPDDELSVFATLRGSLFAVGDDELFEYRATFGRLHPFRIPADEVPDRLVPITQALTLLRTLHVERNRRAVAETIGRLLHATRAHAGFMLRPSGEQALANVLHIAELARAYEASGGISFRGFVATLEEQADEGQAADAPILEEGSDGVRLMTVHKAKGLEFPVVILADMTAHLTGTASRFIDPGRELCAVRIAGWSPPDLLLHEDEELARERAEAIRVAYVAATRARDLLVVPAIGDGEYEKVGWLTPLDRAIFPPPDQRRHPNPAPLCPSFGQDSVVARAHEDVPVHSIKPGLHTFADYGVVWWDPLALRLDAPATGGIRKGDLFAKDVNPLLLDEDLQRHSDWQEARSSTLERGGRPSIRVLTVSEYDAEAPRDVPVDVLELARDSQRPAGRRFGTLVHLVFATVSLDASDTAIAQVAQQQGRIIGATPQEVEAAAQIVAGALRHDLFARARAAEAQGRCRREAPVTLVAPDGALVEGVVDLAIEEESGWTIVDFKTDHEVEQSLDRYTRQLAVYGAAISRATGRAATGGTRAPVIS